jgi:hypothetical protein
LTISCAWANGLAQGQTSPQPVWENPPPPPGPAQPEPPWDPVKALGLSPVPGARQTERLPADLVGQAATFPIGDPQNDLTGLLYVPSYYSPSRTWPVLIEGASKGHLALAMQELGPQAERHGFLLLAVEYLYYKGTSAGSFQAWSREGEVTVQQKSRAIEEYLRDMVVDEKTVRGLLKDLGAAYNVEKRTVAVTGFLGAGLLAYRLPLDFPELFFASIARSGDFTVDVMPTTIGPRAKELSFFVVFGEKEEANTLAASEAAVAFLNSRGIKKVVAEKIPHSGVDSRPEIVGNYLRGAVDAALGPERAALDRAVNLVGLSLADRLPKDVLQPDGRPIDDAAVLAALESFVEKYPRSAYLGCAKLAMARLLAEKLSDRKRAEELLCGFEKAPLLQSADAPDALLYLVEKFVDLDKNPARAKELIGRILSLRLAPAAVTAKARELLARLNKNDKPAGK